MPEDVKSTDFVSNDAIVWTHKNPDLMLIEPPILVSTNFNYLQFSRTNNRPPEKRSLKLVNHGDYPVAFKIQTTDNYSYFVDQVYGIIPARQLVAIASARCINAVTIQVYHRPVSCYPNENQKNFARKDKLFVQLTPYLCPTFSPAAVFHYERPYEKLRILLNYSGRVRDPKETRPKTCLLRSVKGWCTFPIPAGCAKKSADIQQFLADAGSRKSVSKRAKSPAPSLKSKKSKRVQKEKSSKNSVKTDSTQSSQVKGD